MPFIFAVIFAALFFINPLSLVAAKPCIAFDSDFNLYAFGGSTDWSLGQQDSWPDNIHPNKLEVADRPPFNSDNTRCFLSQFFNALYVLGADSQNPSNIHIFDFKAKSWSTQKVNGQMDPTATILDRDTNVFFSLSNGLLSQLDMGTQNSATNDARSWQSVGTPNFETKDYKPVLALASNHIHFLGIPGFQPGEASIFVIHFAFFQPERQSYPLFEGIDGALFPVTGGQAVSFFQDDAHVQQQFAFIPQDGSHTYIVDVHYNRTIPSPGPPDKSPSSKFAASRTALVQLSQAGELFYLPFNPDAFNQDSPNPSLLSASWSKLHFDGLASSSNAGGKSTPPKTANTPPNSISTINQAPQMVGGLNRGLMIAFLVFASATIF